jgi:glycosyltransferase involved in cell wall biosynthesis
MWRRERHRGRNLVILHVTNDLVPDGAQMCLYRLVCAMDRRRFRHIIVSLRDGGPLAARLQAQGVEVASLGLRGRRVSPQAVAAFIARARWSRADVIQAWTYNSNLFATTARAVGIRAHLVWNVRTVPARGELGAFQRGMAALGALLSRVPDAIVYNSHAGAASHAALGYAQKNARVIHNGVPVAEFAGAGARGRAWRDRLRIRDREIVISYVKRVVHPRWHRFFFDAARIAGRERPHLRFVCVGRGADALRTEDARGWPGGGDRIALLGHTDDMAAVYGGSDVAVSASAREGLPNAVAEAMASGVPCAVTDVGDSAVLVGDTGRVARFGDAPGLARAMTDLAEMSDDDRRRLGVAARERIAALFSLERMAAAYAALYEQLLRKGATPPCEPPPG